MLKHEQLLTLKGTPKTPFFGLSASSKIQTLEISTTPKARYQTHHGNTKLYDARIDQTHHRLIALLMGFTMVVLFERCWRWTISWWMAVIVRLIEETETDEEKQKMNSIRISVEV